MHVIRTLRLAPQTMSPGFLRASLDGDIAGAERAASAALPASWPEMPEVLAMRLGQLEADPSLAPWLTRLVVLPQPHPHVVGVAGFHGPPGGAWPVVSAHW